jgi:hypothetical protein
MQIWTNESNLEKMALEYELLYGKLMPAGKSWLIDTPLGEIVNNTNKDRYEINLEGTKIKLDYGQAHYLFLLLLTENTTKVKLLETTIIQSL